MLFCPFRKTKKNTPNECKSEKSFVYIECYILKERENDIKMNKPVELCASRNISIFAPNGTSQREVKNRKLRGVKNYKGKE